MEAPPEPDNTGDQLWTRKQAAHYLQVSRDVITGLVDDGTLPAHVIHRGDRRYLRFEPDDVRTVFKQTGRTRRYRMAPRATAPREPSTPRRTGMEADPWQSTNAARKPANAAGQ